jgi:peroxiredoxin
MRLTFLLALVFSTFLSGYAQKSSGTVGSYRIEGRLKNAANKKIYLTEESFYKNVQKKDSTFANAGGEFLFTGHLDEVTLYNISVTKNGDRKDFYLENSIIQVTGDAAAIGSATLVGSKEEDVRTLVGEMLRDTAISKRYEFASASYEKARKENDECRMDQATQLLAKVRADDCQRFLQFIDQHPGSASGVNLVGMIMDQGGLSQADSILSVLEKIPSGQTGQARYFRTMINRMKALGIGHFAPEFTQADTSGKNVRLSEFRGKYVLLDFWASWCGPCREENPAVVSAFQKYKDSNFTVVSISLDEKKDRWLKAISKDQLTWTHLSDLKGWKNEVAVTYGISSIPRNYLLDPSGRIIAWNLRGYELIKKLRELIPLPR